MSDVETAVPLVEAAAPHRKIATLGILIGLALGALEATIVGTALPSIIASLGGVHLYFLPTSLFMVTSTATTPIWGRLLDVYGRRRFHLLGVVIFLLGSALSGLSRSMTELVIFRCIQGVGAGALLPVSFTMIADLYPGEQRARMQGLVAAVWGLSSLIGPPIGGLITSHFSWRWVFYVNVPVGIVSTIMVQSVWREPAHSTGRRRVDWGGALLTLLTAGSFMMGCALIGRDATWAAIGFAGSAGLALLLVFAERRAPDPFISYDLFRIPLFSRGVACGAVAAVALFGTTTYLTLYMQGVLGKEPWESGAVLVPMTFGWVAVSGAASPLTRRLGYRNLAILGMLLVTAAYGSLCLLPPDASWGRVAISVAVLGMGLGSVLTPLLIAAQNAVPREKLGAATSLTQFSRTMVSAVGVAVMGAMLSATIAKNPVPGVRPEDIVSPVLRHQLPDGVVAAMKVPLDAGLHQVFLVGLAAGVLGLALAILMPRDARAAVAR